MNCVSNTPKEEHCQRSRVDSPIEEGFSEVVFESMRTVLAILLRGNITIGPVL